MPLTVTVLSVVKLMNREMVLGRVAFTGTYSTGGESLPLRDMGFKDGILDFCLFENPIGYVLEYDHSTNRVLAYHADYPAASAGPLIQVPNGSNITAITDARFLAIGS